MPLDTLQARGHSLALYERYGVLLTDHQRKVVDLYLRSDWSLAEIAEQQGTSRAAVHDIVRRSTVAMQEYERRLGLLAESTRRRRALETIERELDALKRRVVRLEGAV
ncbi:MAG: YlxM family DNA-binding protein [Candidatus Dormibacteraceae bacterium]